MTDQERPSTDMMRNQSPSTQPDAPSEAHAGSGVANEIRERAKETAQDARDAAERRAGRWAASMGQRAETLSRALRAAEDSLRGEGEESMASMAGEAADQVERMSFYLEDENPSAMLHDMADLGRRNPGAFLGAAFTIGLAAGRFLRASEPTHGDGLHRPNIPPPVRPSTVSPTATDGR